MISSVVGDVVKVRGEVGTWKIKAIYNDVCHTFKAIRTTKKATEKIFSLSAIEISK